MDKIRLDKRKFLKKEFEVRKVTNQWHTTHKTQHNTTPRSNVTSQLRLSLSLSLFLSQFWQSITNTHTLTYHSPPHHKFTVLPFPPNPHKYTPISSLLLWLQIPLRRRRRTTTTQSKKKKKKETRSQKKWSSNFK